MLAVKTASLSATADQPCEEPDANAGGSAAHSAGRPRRLGCLRLGPQGACEGLYSSGSAARDVPGDGLEAYVQVTVPGAVARGPAAGICLVTEVVIHSLTLLGTRP